MRTAPLKIGKANVLREGKNTVLFFGESGGPDELMKRYGFSAAAICRAVTELGHNTGMRVNALR